MFKLNNQFSQTIKMKRHRFFFSFVQILQAECVVNKEAGDLNINKRTIGKGKRRACR